MKHEKSAWVLNFQNSSIVDLLFFSLHPLSPQGLNERFKVLLLSRQALKHTRLHDVIMDSGGQRIPIWDEVYCYIGHTLFSGIGSWANEPQSVRESSDLGDPLPPTGMRAAMADISPVWLSAVIPGCRSDVWFMLLSGMDPMPVKSWIRHFRNWTENNNNIVCCNSV